MKPLQKINFLTNRLKRIEGPNWSLRNKETMFDYCVKNPEFVYKTLDKNIYVTKDEVRVNEEVLDYNYTDFLKFLNIKTGKIIGYSGGIILERID